MKKVLLIIVAVLVVYVGIAFISSQNLKEEWDEFDRPENCWLAETVIVNQDYETFFAPQTFLTFSCFKSRLQWYGNSGKSGLLSEYTVERLAEMDSESEDTGVYNIYCAFYGSCSPEELDKIYANVSVSLVTDEGIYYLNDEEAFDTQDISLSIFDGNLQGYGSLEPLWINSAPRQRITIEYDPDDQDLPKEEITRVGGYLGLSGVKVKKQGTLYATVKVDIDAERETRKVYPTVTKEVGEGTVTQADPTVNIENFSVGYLTASDYNDGDYAEESIRSDAFFENGQPCYMVLDFSISALADNDGTQALRALMNIGDREVMDISIEEAPTTKLETVIQNDGTSIYATFAIPPNAGEAKTVRMIVRLLPGGEGTASMGVFLLGEDGVELNDVTFYLDKFTYTSAP